VRVFWGLTLSAVLYQSAACAAEMSGGEVVRRSADAYLAVHSYVGETVVRSTGTMDGKASSRTASARIVFLRPGKIRIEGRDTGGARYLIVSDGQGTWTSWDRENGGAAHGELDVASAVGAMSGIGLNAPTTIPAALMKFNWGYPFNLRDTYRLERMEIVGQVNCYKVVRAGPYGVTTYWIDTQSFLLRQMHERLDTEALSALNRVGARLQGARYSHPPKPGDASETLYTFTIEAVNTAIDLSAFQPLVPSGRP